MTVEELLLLGATAVATVVLAYATVRLATHTKGLKVATDSLAHVTARVAAIEEGRDKQNALVKREARFRRRLELGLKFVKPDTLNAWKSSIENNALGRPETDDFLELRALVDFQADRIPEVLVRMVESFIDAIERQKFDALDPQNDPKGAVINLRTTVDQCLPRWRAEHEQAVRDLAAQDG